MWRQTSCPCHIVSCLTNYHLYGRWREGQFWTFFVVEGWASVPCPRRVEVFTGGGDEGKLTECLPSCTPEDVLPVALLPSLWLCVSWSPALSRKEEDLTGDMDGGVLTEYLWGCATKQVLPVVLLKGSSLRVAWTPAFSRKEGGLTGDRDDEGMLTEYLWGCTLEEVLPVILLPSSWLHVARMHSSSLQRYLQLIYPLFSKKNAYAESEWAIFVDPKAHHSSFDDD